MGDIVGRLRGALSPGSDSRDAALLGLANLLGPIGGFAANIAYARTLGPAGRGDLAAVVAALAVCEAVLVFGFADVLTRHVAARAVPTGALRRVVTLCVVASIVPGLLVGWLAVDRGFGVVAVLAVVTLVPLATVAALGRGVLAGRRAFGRLAVSLSLGGVARISAPVILFAVGSERGDLALMLIAVSTAVAAAPVLVARPFADPGHAFARRFRSLATEALGIWPAAMAWSLNARLDQLLLVALVSPSALGKYAVCVTMAELPIVLSSGLRQVILVRASEAGTAGRVLRLVLPILAAGALAAGGALLLGESVMTWLFGEEFADTSKVLAALLMSSAFTISAGLLNSSLIAVGRGRWTLLSQSTGLGLTVLLLVTFIPNGGGIGAAGLIKVVTAASVFLVALLLVRRSERAGLTERILPT